MDLSEILLFKSIPAGDRGRFEKVFEQIDLKKGDTLFSEGDPGDALFIVYRGAIRIFKVIDESAGEEKSLALLEQGAHLGEMTLVDGTPRSASARAESESIVLKISRERFFNLIKESPQAGVRLFISFMKVISDRLRNTNEELVALYEVGKIISSAPPIEEMLAGMLKALITTLDVKTAAIFTFNEYNMAFDVREAIGEGAETIKASKINAGEGIIGAVLNGGELLRVRDFETADNFSGLKRFGFEKNDMIIAPLIRKGKPFGVIFLAERIDGQPFDNANINLLAAVASQAAAGIESALFHQDHAAKEHFDRTYFQF